MIATGVIDLSSLTQRRLSQTQVIIEVNNKLKFSVLTIPEYFKDDGLLDTLCHSFTLANYVLEIGVNEQRSRNQAVLSFIKFVSLKYGLESGFYTGKLPYHCFSDWLDDQQYSTPTHKTWLQLAIIRKILNRTLETRYGKTHQWPLDQKEAWFNLVKNTPSKPRHEKTPPLGKYLGIPHEKFSNKELYMGLRYGVIWLLQKIYRFRELFLTQAIIAEHLTSKAGLTENDLCSSYQGFDDIQFASPKSESEAQLIKVVLATWQVIQTDPLLTEWQSYCWIQHRGCLNSKNSRYKQLITEAQQKLLLSRFVVEQGAILKSSKSYGKKDLLWREFCLQHSNSPLLRSSRLRTLTKPCFWGPDWLIHSELENILMVWLLASERAQKSGIERLVFSDINIEGNSAKTLQISTLKMRRMQSSSTPTSTLNVETQIYKQHEPPFEIYSTWLHQEKKAHRALKNYNSQMRFVHRSSQYIAGIFISNVNKSVSIRNLPLELISVEGTVWNKTFLSQAAYDARNEAEAFIAIIQNRIEKKNSQPNSAIAIPVSQIGQSLIVEQQLENNQNYSFSAIESNSMGHNEITGRNVYKDGFASLRVEEIIEPVKDFARKLGNEKMKLAIDLANRLQTTSQVLTMQELEKICGVETSRSHQDSLLSTLDEQNKLIISGEIIGNGRILVVQTDFTAAMMWGYICHLESSINQIINSERSNTALRYLAQLIHLHHTYKRFDDSLQMIGKTLAAELKFPFPPII